MQPSFLARWVIEQERERLERNAAARRARPPRPSIWSELAPLASIAIALAGLFALGATSLL
jgi:hypothetical protein